MSVNAMLTGIANGLDRVIGWLGLAAGLAAIAMAAITALIVVLRYGFDVGSIALQESLLYLHACTFMLGAAYTLRNGAHVRVDIFYRLLSRRGRAWVDSVGTIVFLLPFCAFVVWVSADYVAEAWRVREVSPDAGGLPAVFAWKTLIPILAVSLALQGLAELLRNLLVLSEARA